MIEQPHVDALIETNVEPAAFDLVDPRLPLLAWLAEEIIVKQMPRPRLAAPHLCDLVGRSRPFQGERTEFAEKKYFSTYRGCDNEANRRNDQRVFERVIDLAVPLLYAFSGQMDLVKPGKNLVQHSDTLALDILGG